MRWLRRRRRTDRALIAALAAENAALRRQLEASRRDAIGNTVPMPRVRSGPTHAARTRTVTKETR